MKQYNVHVSMESVQCLQSHKMTGLLQSGENEKGLISYYIYQQCII